MADPTNLARALEPRKEGGALFSLAQRIERYCERKGDAHPVIGSIAPGPDAVRLFSNDYLGLSGDRRINAAKAEALLGTSSEVLMSAVYLHEDSEQRRFERRMAAFLGTEDCVLSQSGWCANIGLLQTIADQSTPVFLDLAAHASLWEGATSAGAPLHPFRHNNVNHLEELIRRHGPGIVAVDAIYSTSGDLCPIFDLVDLCEREGCALIVDESHSVGTFGARGEGLVAMLGLSERIAFRTLSLSKTFAGRGGIVAGAADALDYFRYEARPAIFSSAVLAYEIVGFERTLEIIESEYWRREQLQVNADYLRGALYDLGYNVTSSQCQIIPLEAGDETRTGRLRDLLDRRGIFGSVFCMPATLRNRALLRFSVTSALDRSELDRAIAACAEIRDEIGLADWPSTRRRARAEEREATDTAQARLRQAVVLRPDFTRPAPPGAA